jgi:antitoxin ParD1/3/4
MYVQLSNEFEELVQSKVRSGIYPSAEEVVIDALRMMGERDTLLNIQKDAIRKKIAEGQASLRRGEGVDGEAAFAEVLADL